MAPVDSEEHSLDIVDNLLRRNGYNNPRSLDQPRAAAGKRRKQDNRSLVPLKIRYISEPVNNKIRNAITKSKLPVRPIFTPGRSLKSIFVKSRPFDNPSCTLGNPANCKICPLFTDGNSCATKDIIYEVTCALPDCGNRYIGEACRHAHDRLSDHCRAAANPASYPDNAVGQHYKQQHPDVMSPKLSFAILDRQRVTQKRAISEAINIFKKRPEMNNREEHKSLKNVLSSMF